MNSNLAHDVYINQGKAIALANQVTDFLLAQGKVPVSGDIDSLCRD